MSDQMFSASVDAEDLVALFERLGPSSDFVCREAARETATRIVAEAQRRVARATGETAAGIHWEMTRSGNGYVVVMGDAVSSQETARREATANSRASRLRAKSTLHQMKHTGIWLEFGTTHQYKRPFLFASADVEAGPHLQRLEDRIQAWLDEVGR